MKKIIIGAIALMLFSLGAFAEEKTEKVYGHTFTSTYILYVMSPDIVGGWNDTLRGYEKVYIPEKYHNLPILGGWYGMGVVPDKEVLLKSGLKKSLVLVATGTPPDDQIKTLESLGMNVAVINAINLTDYPRMFRELGEYTGLKERGEDLAKRAERAIANINAIAKDAKTKPRVYFAQDANGLTTFCNESVRSYNMELVGMENVVKCPTGPTESFVNISFEQLMEYDPDVILVQFRDFYDTMKTDPRWQRLRAAKTGKVFMVPYEPTSWLDRPPSYMRLLGFQWLACKLHPDKCNIDINAETKDFLNNFWHLNLNDAEVEKILKAGG